MAFYYYKVVNEKGEKLEGSYEASSEDEVFAMISSNGYYPISVAEAKKRKSFFKFGMNNKVKNKDLSLMCRQFYTMFSAGLSITACLPILKEQIEQKTLQYGISQVEEKVRKGQTMAEAMRPMKRIFPEFLVNMVASGEESGNIDKVMLKMADYYEKENKTSNKIKTAMIYPVILVIVSLIIMTLLLTFVVPTFVTMFESNEVQIPAITKGIINMSSGIRKWWHIILLAIGAAIGGIVYYKSTPMGRYNIDKLKLRFPLVKDLNEKIIYSRFTSTLSTLLYSGVNLVQSLAITASIMENKVAENEVLKIREKMLSGESLGQVIERSGLFPKMLSSMVTIGETSGKLDEILETTSEFYEEELKAQIQSSIALIEPLMIVIMGVIVGIFMIAMVLPMLNMYNSI